MPEYTGQVTHVELANIPLWLIALFPFVGAAINAIFGRKLQASDWMSDFAKKQHIGSPAVSAVAIGAMLLAFCIALANFIQLATIEQAGERYLLSHAWQMVRIGSLDINFSFAMDPLSGVMTLIVTGVGTLIHIYAASYMETEPAYWRFFCYLNLFIFSMLLLVLGDNFIVMFFGWEGVGLCSYLLIGFWYKDYKKASAGMKAFVVNRVGDWGFICGMALLFWGLGGAWLAHTGEYMPDFRARFMAVGVEALPPKAVGHHGDHGAEGAHGEAKGHAAAKAHAEKKGHDDGHGHGAGDGHGHKGHDHAAHKGHGHKGHDHARGGHKGHDHARGGHGVAGRLNARAKARKLEAEMIADAGKSGTLTMTTHPGSLVYFGIDNAEQLARAKLPRCRDQLSAKCYAETPFIRAKIGAGLHHVAIVPGAGAVISGDGIEVAHLRLRVRADKDTLIAPIGPTLTFRELHDQLVIENGQGQQFLRKALESKTVWGGMGLITLACLCFFVGATGKSAQIPLFVWLPDAMAGPTPVSALIHAATMVTAGVYMIARMNFLFSMSPTASGVVATVGALTALFAATMGFFQYDIKKVLAYSTVSQLGFMFIGVGVGAYWAAVFHLMTHAFFKACLFLASGSVIHGMHNLIHDEDGAQDMRNMGGLAAVMPKTAPTYKIACIAITAAPIPLFAGFWSKDEILWMAFNTNNTGFMPGWLIFAIGLMAALGTSFYMWRSYFLTFEGKHAHRAISKKVKESPFAMTIVLQVLAGLSVVSGLVLGISQHLIPQLPDTFSDALFQQWLHPVTAHNVAKIGNAGWSAMVILMAISVVGAIGMWGMAWWLYGSERNSSWSKLYMLPRVYRERGLFRLIAWFFVDRAQRDKDWAKLHATVAHKTWDQWEQGLPGFQIMHNKYWVDEIYQATVIKAFMKLRLILAEMDRWIVDGLVNGVGVLTRLLSRVAGLSDKHVVDGAVNAVGYGTLEAGNKLRAVQTGRIQNYIYGILGGVAFFSVIQYFFGG